MRELRAGVADLDLSGGNFDDDDDLQHQIESATTSETTEIFDRLLEKMTSSS